MTETQTVTEPDEQTLSLVRKGIEQVLTGKMSLADLLDAGVSLTDPEVDKAPPVTPSLSDAQKEAIQRLPDVFNRVVVTADRRLSLKEQQALVEEREVIDLVLKALGPRKDSSIREVLANHLDHLALLGNELPRKDAKGHFAIKQDVPVEGTGKKIQRSVSGGKPKLTIAHIEELHAEGKIDRKTYLAITKKPDDPRVLDEGGLHKAIQKDPALFFLLGSVAEPTLPITTIKVVTNT